MTPITNNFRSGPSYSIDVDSLRANEMLTDAAARGEDMRPAMSRIKVLFTEGHRENFESRGAFLGSGWEPLSEETDGRKSRELVAGLHDDLVGSGDLQEALSGGAGARTRVSRGSVSVGVATIAAQFTQGGAKGNRRGTQPKRPVLGISVAETEESVSILTDFLMGR